MRHLRAAHRLDCMSYLCSVPVRDTETTPAMTPPRHTSSHSPWKRLAASHACELPPWLELCETLPDASISVVLPTGDLRLSHGVAPCCRVFVDDSPGASISPGSSSPSSSSSMPPACSLESDDELTWRAIDATRRSLTLSSVAPSLFDAGSAPAACSPLGHGVEPPL